MAVAVPQAESVSAVRSVCNVAAFGFSTRPAAARHAASGHVPQQATPIVGTASRRDLTKALVIMRSSTASAEKNLQLEGALVTALVISGRDVRLCLSGADIHYESHFDSHEAVLVVSSASFTGHAHLPSAIVDGSISVLGVGSWGVFVPLPFSVRGGCQVELSLHSGEQIVVTGFSCHVELAQFTRHSYLAESHNLT